MKTERRTVDSVVHDESSSIGDPLCLLGVRSLVVVSKANSLSSSSVGVSKAKRVSSARLGEGERKRAQNSRQDSPRISDISGIQRPLGRLLDLRRPLNLHLGRFDSAPLLCSSAPTEAPTPTRPKVIAPPRQHRLDLVLDIGTPAVSPLTPRQPSTRTHPLQLGTLAQLRRLQRSFRIALQLALLGLYRFSNSCSIADGVSFSVLEAEEGGHGGTARVSPFGRGEFGKLGIDQVEGAVEEVGDGCRGSRAERLEEVLLSVRVGGREGEGQRWGTGAVE